MVILLFVNISNGKDVTMKRILSFLNRFFIDGLSGMALGLFCTLIAGTILGQIGTLIGVNTTVGSLIIAISTVAKFITGAGIGVGVAVKLKEASPLVVAAAGVSGMIGAYASNILGGTLISDGAMVLRGPGEPLGAFLAAYAAIEIAHLVSGKTAMDIIVTPFVGIAVGATVGLLLGSPISSFMTYVGGLINWGTVQQPLLMGIVVSVLMGIALTLPISSAAIGISLGLSGIAAGAAVVGCCAQMVGFAVASYRENKVGGLIAQGVGTSMIQIQNIIRRPLIWFPAILSSAIVGPLSTCVFNLKCNATGAGMGTSGLVGPIMTFDTMMADGRGTWETLGIIALLEFVLPAILALLFSEGMRKLNLIKSGDMKLSS